MSTQIYTNGPCKIWVGTGASFAYEHLGYTEDALNLVLASSWSDVRADYGGPSVPVDVQWMGEQAYASMTLVDYDETVLQSVVSRIPNMTPGTVATNRLGSLMLEEGLAFPLLIAGAYAGKSVFSTIAPIAISVRP